MANVDWILLAVYHFKTAKFTYKETLQVLKGVAGLSMVSPLSKKRAADLHIWAPFKRIATQNELYMCPMALTPARLVNCASLLNKAASDLYILRGNWSLMSIVEYVAIQLEAQGGIHTIKKETGTTSSIEWMVHRLLLAGESGNPAIYLRDQKSPLQRGVTVTE